MERLQNGLIRNRYDDYITLYILANQEDIDTLLIRVFGSIPGVLIRVMCWLMHIGITEKCYNDMEEYINWF